MSLQEKERRYHQNNCAISNRRKRKRSTTSIRRINYFCLYCPCTIIITMLLQRFATRTTTTTTSAFVSSSSRSWCSSAALQSSKKKTATFTTSHGGTSSSYRCYHRRSRMKMTADSRELRFFSAGSSSDSRNSKILDNPIASLSSPVEAILSTMDDQRKQIERTFSISTKIEISATTTTKTTTKRKKHDDDNNNNESLYNKNIKNNNDNEKQVVAQQKERQQVQQQSQVQVQEQFQQPRKSHPLLDLTDEERELFDLLTKVIDGTNISSTLRVAGGWVRDKLLSTSEYAKYHSSHHAERLTSKSKTKSTSSSSIATTNFQPSLGRQGTKVLKDVSSHPVDIDIALDDMLGREFADHLNEYLSEHGQQTVSVGVVLKNPEKSKHLETATMKVNTFWIDFVNLRAEEYTQDSRIPDLMRIGTAAEDAFRRDLTINTLFYNINTKQVEDWTGRGFDDLQRGVVSTPMAPLTTLLDDPLRVLRSVRFAARLRFAMDDALVDAAKDVRVRCALAQKVSRERVGGEVDLMLRSLDPVGAMRLLINLNLADTVFPMYECLPSSNDDDNDNYKNYKSGDLDYIFNDGLTLLTATHDHLCDCKENTPVWCESKAKTGDNVEDRALLDDEETRRLLWYASFLKPYMDLTSNDRQLSSSSPDSSTKSKSTKSKRRGKKANRSAISKLLVDKLKRPARDADSVERIMKAADDITKLVDSGCDFTALDILMNDVKVEYCSPPSSSESSGGEDEADKPLTRGIKCSMGPDEVNSDTETSPFWNHAMDFRLRCSKALHRVGPMWRAAIILSLSEQLVSLYPDGIEYAIEGDVVDDYNEKARKGTIQRYNIFAAALQQMGLVGIWSQQPLLNGEEMKAVLQNIPKGPAFRNVMEEQEVWMTTHPCGTKGALIRHMKVAFPKFL